MLAYYSHSQGCGHSRFAALMSEYFKGKFKVFTSCPYYFEPGVPIVKLPTEDPDGTGIPAGKMPAPEYLHYSPVNQESIKNRSLKLLTGLINSHVQLLIVDVSVEVAALARVSSIPYAYVRLPGNRNDPAHIQAFQGAVFLLAYYPEEFEPEDTPKWVREKTIYLGFQSRFQFETTVKPSQLSNILLAIGKGGSENIQKTLDKIQQRFSTAEITAIGDFEKNIPERFPKIHFPGFVDNVQAYIEKADLVVASCGLNSIGEILASGKPFICIPEKRPFQEQHISFQNLKRRNHVLDIDEILEMNDKELLDRHFSGDELVQNSSMERFRAWLEKYEYDPLKLFENLSEMKKPADAYA